MFNKYNKYNKYNKIKLIDKSLNIFKLLLK